MAKLLQFNDVAIVYEYSDLVPLVTMELVFENSGALSAGAGVAHLCAKLLGEGTQSEGSLVFAESLESRAVSISAHVGAETFVVSVSAMQSEFGFALERLIDLLKEPNYTKEAFEKVYQQQRGELTQRASNYDYVASCNLKELLFANTPAAYPNGGTLESLELIGLEDLKSHISSHLGVGNLVVVIGGLVDEKQAQEYTKKILDVLPSVKSENLKHIPTAIEPKTQIQNREHIDQAYIYFGSPYLLEYGSDEDYIGKVAAFILGSSGFGSRLMEEIRVERGLAYSAYASLRLNKTTGYLLGYLQTKIDNADEATNAVKELFGEFVKNGATQKELDSAKKFLLGSEPLRYETLNQRLSISFDEYYSGRELGYKKQELELIERLELKDLNSFIGSHEELARLSFAIVTK